MLPPLPSFPPPLPKLARSLADAGGELLLVGGAVRDWLLGRPWSGDLDAEAFGVTPERLEAILARFGPVHAVGRSFGVFKLAFPWGGLDVSLPRRESKHGLGHRGFVTTSDPAMPFAEAASRRDFTLNAMGLGLLSGQLHDPWGGRADLEKKVLRHVGPAFAEDPLRVLRAMQFAARFDLTVAPETLALCRSLDLAELPRERIFEEFRKLLLLAPRPSLGLNLMEPLGILPHFPELAAMVGVPQDPEWHPEGDVWVHTLRVVDQAATMHTGDPRRDLTFMLGALCHDLGKPMVTVFQEGRWRSPGHETLGLPVVARFLERITADRELVEGVLTLVREHLIPAQLYKVRHEVKPGSIRRLALRVSIPELVRFARADHFGRTTPEALAGEFPPGAWLLERAATLEVEAAAPRPILMGRHLLELGMTPGPHMGEILRRGFEVQLDGRWHCLEEALAWARKEIEAPKE